MHLIRNIYLRGIKNISKYPKTGGSAVLSSNSSHTSDEGFASISDGLDDRNIHILIISRDTLRTKSTLG